MFIVVFLAVFENRLHILYDVQDNHIQLKSNEYIYNKQKVVWITTKMH